MQRHVYKSQSPPDEKEFLSKQVAKGRVGEMWCSMWRCLVTQGMQKAEVLKAIFTSIFTNKTGFQKSQRPGEEEARQGARKIYLWWKRIRSEHKQVKWTYINLWALMRGTQDCQGSRMILLWYHLIMFGLSWWLRKVPEDRRKANAAPIFRKGKEEGRGSYRSVSFTSIPGKVMEQLILETFPVI